MAIVRTAPYTVGDVAKLWPANLQSEWVEITAPNGQRMRLRRVPGGRAEVWLLQPGTWQYRWSDTDHGTLHVVAAPTEPIEPPAATRWVQST